MLSKGAERALSELEAVSSRTTLKTKQSQHLCDAVTNDKDESTEAFYKKL